MKNRTLFILAILFITFFSCKKAEQYSETPNIKFKSFELKDTIGPLGSQKKGTLLFSFTDGNGDVGDDSLNTAQDSIKDVFIKLFKMENNIFSEDTTLTVALSFSFPDIPLPQGPNKNVKGDIIVTLWYDNPPPIDTVKYLFYIKDKARHQSNTNSTPVINLKHPGYILYQR